MEEEFRVNQRIKNFSFPKQEKNEEKEKRQGTILKSHASPFYFFTGKYILSLISFNLYAQTLSCRFLIVRFFKQFLHSLNSYKHTKNQQ